MPSLQGWQNQWGRPVFDGDLKYHEAQDAAMNGLVIADGGHFYTERVIIPYLAKRLRDEFKTRGWNIGVLEDVRSKDIFCCV